ncbi:unnamed protein product [Cyclocybe aegerita]|uniref:G domain-containing protein n=1 Tax=Cyclocybe aegerita TaxID=1973307 RepID=A0A8S0VZM0_CYCAE|nr:unnamed protein product [Cyclocybe aegerita]
MERYWRERAPYVIHITGVDINPSQPLFWISLSGDCTAEHAVTHGITNLKLDGFIVSPKPSLVMDEQPPFNVVLFGESGCGKSSIVNMLLGSDAAATSGGGRGCTFQSAGYDIVIGKKNFRIHDTAGLEEGEKGRVPAHDAIVQLYKLLRSLEDGVSLLVFCMKAPRVKKSGQHNWILFHDIMCQSKVPIAIVVTGLEEEDDMDEWWEDNEDVFREYGMLSHGHACITAIRGKKKNGRFIFQEEYDESKVKVENMIRKCYKVEQRRLDKVQWFRRVLYETRYEHHCFWTEIIKEEVGEIKGALDDLVSRCGMPEKDAKLLAEELSRVP